MKKSIYAGMMIGLAGWLNLSAGGGILGSILFSIGLYLVCLQGLNLYTGKAGSINLDFVHWKDSMKFLFCTILIGNIIGTAIIAGLAKCTGIDASGIIEVRDNSTWWLGLVRGIGCGMLMEFAVWGWREFKNPILIFLCVPAFILSGMYHCIADSFYYILTWDWSWNIVLVYLMTIIGNFIGCNVRRIMS